MGAESREDLLAYFDPDEFGIAFDVEGGPSGVVGMYDGPYAAALALGPDGVGIASDAPTITCPAFLYPTAAKEDTVTVVKANDGQAELCGKTFTVEQVEPSGDGLVLLRLFS